MAMAVTRLLGLAGGRIEAERLQAAGIGFVNGALDAVLLRRAPLLFLGKVLLVPAGYVFGVVPKGLEPVAVGDANMLGLLTVFLVSKGSPAAVDVGIERLKHAVRRITG